MAVTTLELRFAIDALEQILGDGDQDLDHADRISAVCRT